MTKHHVLFEPFEQTKMLLHKLPPFTPAPPVRLRSQAMTLPCSIQLFPRVDRRSLVCVDGREAPSYRARKYTAATIDRRPGDRGAAAAATAGAGGGSAGDGQQRAAAVFKGRRERGASGGGQGRVERAAGRISSISGSGSGVRDTYPNTAVVATGDDVGAGVVEGARPEEDGERWRSGDTLRLVGEMEIDKPAYLQVLTTGLHVLFSTVRLFSWSRADL